MEKSFLKICSFFVFAIVCSRDVLAESYGCNPINDLTANAFRGYLFQLEVTNTCIDLKNIETKDNWTWKVVSKNSLGNKDGVRMFCNEADTGLQGLPVYWEQSSLRLVAFDQKKISEFKCFLRK